MKRENKHLVNVITTHRLLGTVCHSNSAACDTSLGSNPDYRINEREDRVTLR